ncbi:adenylate/guanylate cyclase domain-containing protein [Tumidithrix elongata RA019]|uniref:Adenylate cyclase n=1 Tax=Tumidithrix elongata BACA0141 TaxID=2716417 RepID=A0AAW9PZZ2_9CYAN|nr:adenylate/guanylate cyclase domain-containing protein [Tumidithrix elongata RA019]
MAVKASDKTSPRSQNLFNSVFRFLSLPTPSPSSTPDYYEWRTQFMRSRLYLLAWVGLICNLSFIVWTLTLRILPENIGPSGHFVILGIQVLNVAIFIACILFLRFFFNKHYIGYFLLVPSLSTILSSQVIVGLGGIYSPAFVAWVLIFLGNATLVPVRWQLHLTLQIASFLGYFAIIRAFGEDIAHVLTITLGDRAIPSTIIFLLLIWVCIMENLSVFLYERLQKSEFMARSQLNKAYQELTFQKERSEQLLLNILPQSIAERLKDRSLIVDSFADVTVLFADIVGFTQLSAQIPPSQLVELLNQIFSRFDRLAEGKHLEKIKTIGDAYMVVAGLPLPLTNHAEAIAEMALGMREEVNRFNHESASTLQIRIGISSGPVVAGVIGIKKFAYDLWGDTVNTASRMESHGLPNCIQVSETTYAHLKGKYEFQLREGIDIKGKGTMTTYLLQGKHHKQ